MNNYYDILEVSQKASKEIIEKAYKVLAKRYHPDLQQANKKEAEEKMKLINEAYEVLSDDEKRKEYDAKLELEKNSKKDYHRMQQDEIKEDNSDDIEYEDIQDTIMTKKEMKQQIKEEKRAEKEFQDEQERLYRNYMRSLGYRIKERWTFKKFLKLIEVIVIFFIAIVIVWLFPPTHKLLVQTYEENYIIRVIVGVIGNIIKGIINGISVFFKRIFN